MIRAIPPMMAVPATALPSGADWSYEVKWDGYRAQIVKQGAAIALASRNLKNITKQYPAVARAAAGVHAATALIDGEIVALDRDGRPSFQGLHHADLDGLSIVYYAFDLLHLDGRDLTRAPLDERRDALRAVVDGSDVLLSDSLPGTTKQITAAVERLGLEGIVAKRRRSVYVPGRRSDAWVKVRFSNHQEFVVGGFKPAGDTFDSIVVGYYDGKQLMSAGKVRAGFTPHARAELFARLASIETRTCPFANLPSGRGGHWGEGIGADEMLALRWVKPKVVVEASFTEWTRDGSLRHAAYIGPRDDKPAREVRRDPTCGRRE